MLAILLLLSLICATVVTSYNEVIIFNVIGMLEVFLKWG